MFGRIGITLNHIFFFFSMYISISRGAILRLTNSWDTEILQLPPKSTNCYLLTDLIGFFILPNTVQSKDPLGQFRKSLP